MNLDSGSSPIREWARAQAQAHFPQLRLLQQIAVARFRRPFCLGCSGCLLVAVALGLGLDSLGVGVGLSGLVSFRWGPTTEEALAPTQEPAVIRRSLDGSSLAVSVAIQRVSY